MVSRRRRYVFATLVAASVVAAVASILLAPGAAEPSASAGARTALETARAERRPVAIVRPAGGQIAVARLDRGTARRIRAPLRCDRVYYAGGRGLCLARGEGFAAGYRAKIFGSDFRVRGEVGVAGVPSRARVSPDGRYGSVTLFVTGDSYTEAGSFSTRTTLIDMERGEKIADLEEFTVTRAGKQVTAIDTNFWGVTFARDSDRFYATMATGGKTYLVVGSVERRTARVIHQNVECPSLSPDGTRVAFKRRTGSDEWPWRLTVLDLATMRETPLAELRSVDDQAEWMGDDEVLYGLEGDVWRVRADGRGEPRRLLSGASSPAVMRW